MSSQNTELTIDNCTFINNTAMNLFGGTLAFYYQNFKIILKNSIVN